MKQGHFALLFCILFAVCFLMLSLEQLRYDTVLEEKQRVEQCLLTAVENTAREFSKVLYAPTEKKQQVLEQEFFNYLYAAFGVLEEREEQERLRMHIPMLVLVEEDGIQFFHMKEVMQEGTAELQHQWTSKESFCFDENMQTEEKKVVIVENLEKKAAEIITEHNYIAKQYGWSYTFTVPRFLQNTAKKTEFPMLFVVFQGWPLIASGEVRYENCLDAGVYLQEVRRYIIELPKSPADSWCYYHKEGCQNLNREVQEILKEQLTEREAIRKYGAIPCEKCN